MKIQSNAKTIKRYNDISFTSLVQIIDKLETFLVCARKPGFIWFAKELVYVRENDARFGIGVNTKE